MQLGVLQLEEDFPFWELGRMPWSALAISAALHGVVAAALYVEPHLMPRALSAPQALEFTVDLSTPSPQPDAQQEEAPPLIALPDPPPLPMPLFALPTLEQAVADSDPVPPPSAPEFAALRMPAEAPARSPTSSPLPDPPRPAPPAKPAAHPPLVPPRAASPVKTQPAAAVQSAGDGRREQSRRRAQEDYLWLVIRRLAQMHYTTPAGQKSEQGMVVTRLTVARDGRLVGVTLAQSSGFPNLDRGVIESIRRAAPFAPLPADIADDPYTFIVPINYARER